MAGQSAFPCTILGFPSQEQTGCRPLKAGWLQRSCSVFYRYVLRWRTLFALPAVACAVPAALTLSVAWSVLYSNPGPWLRFIGRFWRLWGG